MTRPQQLEARIDALAGRMGGRYWSQIYRLEMDNAFDRRMPDLPLTRAGAFDSGGQLMEEAMIPAE